jgi:adenylate kinase
MAPGTTIADPVAVDHKPDLSSSLYEISEYLENQQAYDLFDFMLRELLITQPHDPLQHMIDCLECKIASGPLQVFVSSAPGVGRTDLCKRLAENYGLDYICSGDLLRERGVKTQSLNYADDETMSNIVLENILQARKIMRGFVLDGFPRTRLQACKLQEHSIVPTHVLVLKANREAIMERQEQIASGKLEGEYVPMDVLEGKLNQYTCHSSSALESYAEKIKVIDASLPPNTVYAQMEQSVRMLPRSKGPGRPPRVLMLGPRGTSVREHASRLAVRLGAVFINGGSLMSYMNETSSSSQVSSASMTTSIDVPHVQGAAADDPLGILGLRLRQKDCQVQGYVLCGFDAFDALAQTLASDVHLCPTRIVALQASAEVCIERLRYLAVDSVTGKIWTSEPSSEVIRTRLQRDPADAPAAVQANHAAYAAKLQVILGALSSDGNKGKYAEIQADGDVEDVFSAVVDFVERPLPLPPSS